MFSDFFFHFAYIFVYFVQNCCFATFKHKWDKKMRNPQKDGFKLEGAEIWFPL